MRSIATGSAVVRGRARFRANRVLRRENRLPPKTFFGVRRRARERRRRADAATVDVAPERARTTMRCETRSCFQVFFRERFRAQRTHADLAGGIARASTAVPSRSPPDRPGTFVLQKC
jgi:hypothetical protein